MKRAAVGLIAGLIASPFAISQSAWDLVFREQLDWTDRAHRLTLARDLVDRISLLEANLPELPDKDRVWIENLEAKIDRLGGDASSRERGELYLSRQYQQRALLQHVDAVKAELACIRVAQPLDREMPCWSRLSVLLLDGDRIGVALETLRDYRMVPRSRDMPVKAQHPSLWYADYGRGIVEYLLVPYLEAHSQRDERPDD